MGQTSIEWTDHSINPIRARLRSGEGKTVGGYGSGVGHFCEKISPGCANCYASTSQPRFGMPGFPGAKKRLPTLPVIAANGAVPVSGTVEVFFDKSRLREVLNRKKPTKWFWFDQTDAFGSWVPFDWLDKCFAVMALTPHHTHQILTKRPERMAEYLSETMRVNPPESSRPVDVCAAHRRIRKASEIIAEERSGGGCWREHYNNLWPLPRVWLGTSAEDQATYDARREHLMACPAAVRFLSLEPLLGPIIIPLYPDRTSIRWVIIGGESGPGARPCDVANIRSLVSQFKVANVPTFVKQLGAHVIDHDTTGATHFEPEECWPDGTKTDHHRVLLKDKKGGDWTQWPEDLRVRQFPAPAREAVPS